MMTALQFIVICFNLLITAAVVRSDVDDTMIYCCRLGTDWARQGQNCLQFSLPIADVQESQQESCKSSIELCCKSFLNDIICGKGILRAKSNKDCVISNDTCMIEGLCCEACKLGRKNAQDNGTCLPPQLHLSMDLVFENCCKELQQPSPKGKKNSKKFQPDTITDEDYDDYSTYDSNNLCNLLPDKLCAHICIPTPGSYYCACNKGYYLAEDQKTCHPDKKLKSSVVPHPNIVPNPERPVPLYKPKTPKPAPVPLSNALSEESLPKPKTYFQNTTESGKETCEIYNPCEHTCTNTQSGLECACKSGYELGRDRQSCDDIDECRNNVYLCDPELEDCVNEAGGYRCQPKSDQIVYTTTLDTPRSTEDIFTVSPQPALACPQGFKRRYGGGCEDIDECQKPDICDTSQSCLNTMGGFECRCNEGFTLDPITRACVDVNECQTNKHDCASSQRCDNTIGSYQCMRTTGCGTGYTLNAQTGQCEDDDECYLGTDNCRYLGQGYQCRNTLGSFRCERIRCRPGDLNCSSRYCPRGFRENEQGQCIDVNECTSGAHNCHQQQQCINKVGGFECKAYAYRCSSGLENKGTGCVDIDECATNTHSCKGSAQCRNHHGGYSCTCSPGYQIDSNYNCIDVNECELFSCPFEADCQNTMGSFRCICKNGFRNVDNNLCEDVNECQESPGICQQNCTNFHGSYRCTCIRGYYLHENNRSCVDNDECEMFKSQGLCIGDCVNIPGSYSCSCPPGYKLAADKRSCQDIDECIKNPCRGEEEVCTNTRGGHRCNSIKCPQGYVKDSEQMNRCKRINRFCREGDTNCFLQPLSYSFNFITFVSNLPIPPTGHLDLFTMRGSLWNGAESQFNLDFISARAPPGVHLSTKDDFKLRNTGWNQAAIALIHPIQGPQELELQLVMNIYQYGRFNGVAVAKLFIHISAYEF